ncbi:carboxypeptidase A5 isoform 1 [Corchorus olitorius]|uniref:Carboxypeptidase A5 isoform 1 n=1 Tax=Corchorus olitorius TaxID=93759 RepID=A0A1R3GQI9_9ROSI|nr:carboxypeptidase A5 isoform 1 [Corchorus olitorius]
MEFSVVNEIATGFAMDNGTSLNQLWQMKFVGKLINPCQIISHGPRPVSNPEVILMLKYDFSGNFTRNFQRNLSKIIVPKPVGKFAAVFATDSGLKV